MRTVSLVILIAVSVVSAPSVTRAAATTSIAPYKVQQEFTLGGAGGWDYLALDTDAHRLYISRADRVLVVDAQTGTVLTTIADTAGVHGIALAGKLGKGFTSNGRSDSVTEFDLATSKPVARIAIAGHNPDAILFDSVTGHVFTFNGRSNDVSVIDPGTRSVIATIAVGGKPEFAVTDNAGRIFVNIEDKSQLLAIDAVHAKISATWPLPHCEDPSGLALDANNHRLFSTCANGVMAITDSVTGRAVASVPIGKGPDAAAFDAARALVFSSNGQDGTLSIIHQDAPDQYSTLATVPTQTSARTMVLDAKTHRVYLVAAQFGNAPAATPEQPHPRPPVLENSFKVIVVGN
jgi:YVTN family beta-propeller protein